MEREAPETKGVETKVHNLRTLVLSFTAWRKKESWLSFLFLKVKLGVNFTLEIKKETYKCSAFDGCNI